MNYRNICFFVIAASLLSACVATGRGQDNRKPLNSIPMYGHPEIKKSEKLRKADEKFVKGILSSSGDSRENVSKEVSAIGWVHFQKGDLEGAMRRFNQAWLLNPNSYDPHWGFGALLLGQDMAAEAARHMEKAVLLNDDSSKKPRLLSDTARAYSSQGNKESDKLKRAMFFGKANSTFMEAVSLDPEYGNAYRAWALSLFLEGDYKKAWSVVEKHRSLGGDSLSSDFIDALKKKMPEPK